MNQTILYLPGLSPVAGKDLCARFDGGRLSSDGGVLVLREIERRLGVCDLLASCMPDQRAPASIAHSHANMIRARHFSICGVRTRGNIERRNRIKKLTIQNRRLNHQRHAA